MADSDDLALEEAASFAGYSWVRGDVSGADILSLV